MHSTRILLIRHGETAWNKDGRIQGQTDIALNATGQWQAAQAAQALRDEALTAVYSSDLSRALNTAQAIAQVCALPVTQHVGLRERHFGQCQGWSWAELVEREPALSESWRRRVPDFAPPGGESLLVLQQRVILTLNELAARHLDQAIAVVTHGGVLDIVYRAATGLDLQAPRTWLLANAAINRVLWSAQGLSLIGWGDVAHLESAAADETSA